MSEVKPRYRTSEHEERNWGSEDDLRTEITKAGGFATQSQILGLTNARNRQLIKNYNTLLDTRNAKEKYLQTAI